MNVKNPCKIKDLDEVVEFLGDRNTRDLCLMSVDVKDLYDSIPRIGPKECVTNCRGVNGMIGFRSTCGIGCQKCLDLLSLYLEFGSLSLTTRHLHKGIR